MGRRVVQVEISAAGGVQGFGAPGLEVSAVKGLGYTIALAERCPATLWVFWLCNMESRICGLIE